MPQTFGPDEMRRVTVAVVHRYLTRAGWTRRPREEGGFWYDSPPSVRTVSGEPLTLYFPDSEAGRDYPQRVHELLRSVSDLEDRSMVSIWQELSAPAPAARNGRKRSGSGT